MRKIKVVVLLVRQLQHGFTKNAKMSPNLTVTHIGLYRDVWIAAIASSTTSLATRTAATCVRFQGRRVRRV